MSCLKSCATTLSTAVLLFTHGAVARANPRDAVENALPVVQAGGVKWIETKKCVSCHRVSAMTWALSAARDAGFEIDQDDLQQRIDWSIEVSLKLNEEDNKPAGSRNLDGLAQILLAPDSPPETETDQFVSLLIDGQQEDGTWKPAGQLPMQKRPKPETIAVSTLWNALALRESSDDVNAQEAIKRALTTIDPEAEIKSTEWYVARLLIAAEGDREAVSHWQSKLLDIQQSDGGWGWLIDEPSDALATGMALYALAMTGLSREDESIQRAVSFLTETQNGDGSWSVNGTKQKKRDRVEETASYWGTCWAVIGLCEALPLESAKPDVIDQ